MKLVFVSGPFRHPMSAEIEENRLRARLRAAQVLDAGHLPVTPHQLSICLGAPETHWLDGFLELLRRCDEVWLVEGWEQSEGCLDEIAAAFEAGLPVFLPDGQRLYGIRVQQVIEYQVPREDVA